MLYTLLRASAISAPGKSSKPAVNWRPIQKAEICIWRTVRGFTLQVNVREMIGPKQFVLNACPNLNNMYNKSDSNI